MGIQLIKPIPIYIKISTNKLTVTRLDNNETITRTAKYEFSNVRLVLAHFDEAQVLLFEILDQLRKSILGFSKNLICIIHQTERTEGGLSGVEIRPLIDLCKFSGGTKVKVFEQDQVILSRVQALKVISEM